MKQVWTNIEGNRANLVQTAWALLSLIEAGQVSASFSPQLFALHYNIALLHSTKECNAFEKEQISLKKSSYIYIYIYMRIEKLRFTQIHSRKSEELCKLLGSTNIHIC
jgi:hypothetical protein